MLFLESESYNMLISKESNFYSSLPIRRCFPFFILNHRASPGLGEKGLSTCIRKRKKFIAKSERKNLPNNPSAEYPSHQADS